jgi:anti-anti-sigma regulatory factor
VKKRRAKAKPKTNEAYKLGSRLSIAEAAELHRALLARLMAGAPIFIDGTEVREIDTSVLQLFVSLWRTAAARDVAVAWQGVSEALRKSAELIGVARHIDLKDSAQLAHA